MGILANILGTGEVIKEGFKLIDSLHTSDTEMIEATTKAKTDLLSAYAPFKIAQRYIALMFGFTFLFSFFLILAMTLGGIGDLKAAREVIVEFQIGWIMLTIVGFYFGGGAFESLKGGKNG
jgi:hypothetical protein